MRIFMKFFIIKSKPSLLLVKLLSYTVIWIIIRPNNTVPKIRQGLTDNQFYSVVFHSNSRQRHFMILILPIILIYPYDTDAVQWSGAILWNYLTWCFDDNAVSYHMMTASPLSKCEYLLIKEFAFITSLHWESVRVRNSPVFSELQGVKRVIK
jgi:hypothetical protein